MTNFNPRSAIGYYEPGHYCLFVCEGRSVGESVSLGLKMTELAQFFADLGCKAAYNFDGGATAIMVDAAHEISLQSQHRGCSDIVYIAKTPETADSGSVEEQDVQDDTETETEAGAEGAVNEEAGD